MSKRPSSAGQPGAGEETAAESAPPPPASPALDESASYSHKDDAEPQTLSQAVSEFDRARLELSRLIGRELAPIEIAEGSATAGAPPRDAPKSQAPAPAAAAPESKRSRAESEDRSAEPAKKADDGCVTVCRAFDSLTRSAAAVCRLDEGERCRKANSVVAVAQGDAGVKACACKK